MSNVKSIHHIGILVENIEDALKFWRDTLGIELDQILDAPAEMSMVAFLPVGGSEIELIQPTTSDSGIARYLEKRGPGMHHICLEVDDLKEMLSQLRDKGFQLINEEPQIGEDGRLYAFIHPKSTSGVMVELYEIPV
jgi:methylmalonyl-CoA/ethylmalonyl-CoA epimerase